MSFSLRCCSPLRHLNTWSASDGWFQFAGQKLAASAVRLHQQEQKNIQTSLLPFCLLICFDQIFDFYVDSQIWCNLSLLITVTHAKMTNALMGDSGRLMGSLLNHMCWNWVRHSPSWGGPTCLHTFNPVSMSGGVRRCWSKSITPSKWTMEIKVASGREASVKWHY